MPATPVNAAINEGLLIITAAGNDNDEVASYLGTRSDVLAVAATDQSDVKASFSSYGSWVELSAPGVGIYTTAYSRFSGESTYATVQGTSFSSPIACGAAALLWSANPTYTRQQIAALLGEPLHGLAHQVLAQHRSVAGVRRRRGRDRGDRWS